MAELKGYKAYLVTGEEFESYFFELLHDFASAFKGRATSRSFNINKVYEKFQKFVIRDVDRIFNKRKIAAIFVMFRHNFVEMALNGLYFLWIMEGHFGIWDIKKMLEEEIKYSEKEINYSEEELNFGEEELNFGESFYEEEETKPHLGLKENKTSRLLSHFGLLDFKDKNFKKGGR